MKSFILIIQIQQKEKKYLPIKMVGNEYPSKENISEILDFLNSTIQDYFVIDIIGYANKNKKRYFFNKITKNLDKSQKTRYNKTYKNN